MATGMAVVFTGPTLVPGPTLVVPAPVASSGCCCGWDLPRLSLPPRSPLSPHGILRPVHRFGGLYLEVPQDLSLAILQHLWRHVPRWPGSFPVQTRSRCSRDCTIHLAVVFHLCRTCRHLTPARAGRSQGLDPAWPGRSGSYSGPAGKTHFWQMCREC